jgi:hypothetical protein
MIAMDFISPFIIIRMQGIVMRRMVTESRSSTVTVYECNLWMIRILSAP